MVFPDKDHIDFFSFFHRKGLEIVWNNFNENFLFFFYLTILIRVNRESTFTGSYVTRMRTD